MVNPIAMGYHRMAYDIESDQIVLVAGQGNYCSRPQVTTSVFDLNTRTWQMLETNSPEPHGEGPVGYDAQSDRIIQFIFIVRLCVFF
jgi:hypothetical protein